MHSVNVKNAVLRLVGGGWYMLTERRAPGAYAWVLPPGVAVARDRVESVEFLQVMEHCAGDLERDAALYVGRATADRVHDLLDLADTLVRLALCGGMLLTDAKRANVLLMATPGFDGWQVHKPVLGDLGAFFPADSLDAITTFRLPFTDERADLDVDAHAAQFGVMSMFILADALVHRHAAVEMPQRASRKTADAYFGSIRALMLNDAGVRRILIGAQRADLNRPASGTAVERYVRHVELMRRHYAELYYDHAPSTPQACEWYRR